MLTAPAPRTLALVLAGGAGSRLGVLTDRRAKPALPFAGHYRLIDVPLSNAAHSGIADVGVVEQYQPHGLNDHLRNGRPWDLDRSRGGLRLLPPFEGTGDAREGLAHGNADALYQHAHAVRARDPDLVLVLSADHLYQLDFRRVIAHHREAGAALTVVTTEVEEDPGRYAVLQVARGRVVDFAYKPDEPKGHTVAAEVFLYDARTLLGTLDALAHEHGSRLGDYGDHLLPHFAAEEKTAAFALDGYWRDVGLPESYWQAHQDLLGDAPAWHPDDPEWPLLTPPTLRLGARITDGARVVDSLVSPGAVVHGAVERSVIGPGVTIEAGAEVRDAVVLHDAWIGAGAQLTRAIVDQRSRIGDGARVGRAEGALAVIGMGVTVPARGVVEAGTEIAPPTPGRPAPAGGR